MNDIEQMIEALQRRVAALEAENARLRQHPPRQPAPARGTSRRQLLVGGAGVLGALAGGRLMGHVEPALAASAAPIGQATPLRLRVPVVPMKTRGALWAEHVWDLGDHFRGEQLPVVIATAVDDQAEHELSPCAVCAVSVQGRPGAYQAKIMVRNISTFATSVVISAIAVGD